MGQKPRVFFIHGLNTFGDDIIHIGAATFGPMHTRLENNLRAHGIDFAHARGLKAYSPIEQANEALNSLIESGWLNDDEPIHLLGHSIGGLVARVLVREPRVQKRVRQILTYGTPHGGAEIAAFGLEFSAKHPLVSLLIAALGYDTRIKNEFYRHLIPTAMTAFNESYLPLTDIEEISLICQARGSEISLPLLGLAIFHRLQDESDAFIRVSSQTRGRSLGPYHLDHYAQLGLFLHATRAARKFAHSEFERLGETIAGLASK